MLEALESAPCAKVACLRQFSAEPPRGKEGPVEWQQSMGSLSLLCPLEGKLDEDDISVKASSCQLQILLKDKPLAALSGFLFGSVLPRLSWWRLHREATKRRTRGVDEAWEKLSLFVELSKGEHRSWPRLWYNSEMKHPSARAGYAWTPAMDALQDFQDRTQLLPLTCGFPQRSRQLSSQDGMTDGGGGFLFAPDDLCIGIDALQDDRSITLRVHFEAEALAVVQRIVPLEELLAADILDDRVNVFLRGDEQNPILWALLAGRCSPKQSNWKLTTSDCYRSRQRDPAAPGWALAIVLQKHKEHLGHWDRLFTTCLQHPLMLRNYEELEDLIEALKGDDEDTLRLSPEERQDFQQRLANWKEERFEGLPGAQVLPRTPDTGFALGRQAVPSKSN